MRIGSDDSFFSLERVAQEGPVVVWRVAAGVAGVNCIAAVHGRVRVLANGEGPARIADFRANRVKQLQLRLSQGGWLRVKRDERGRTVVRYRLGHVRAGAALEGRIRLEGDETKGFCRELRGLL